MSSSTPTTYAFGSTLSDVTYLAFCAYYAFLIAISLKSFIPLIKENSPMLPGFMAAQWCFNIALCFRFAGYFFCMILNIVKKQSNRSQLLAAANGLPGYVTSIAYIYLFFLWCSVIMSIAAREITDYYEKRRTMISIVSFAVLVLGLASFIANLCENSETPRIIEAIIATLRDFILAIIFSHSLIKVSSRTQHKMCETQFSESVVQLMCLMVIVALIVRSVSIVTYNFGIVGKCEDTATSYWINIIETVACEFFPQMMIIRLKNYTGTFSTYDMLE